MYEKLESSVEKFRVDLSAVRTELFIPVVSILYIVDFKTKNLIVKRIVVFVGGKKTK